MNCPECDYVARTKASLAIHKREVHPRPTGPNALAVEVTLAELERMGRLEKVDTARIQALRSIAEAVDLNPFNSQMWREYREAIGVVTVDDRDSGSSINDLLDELSAPVRDETKG